MSISDDFRTARDTRSFIYCGDERCTFAEAIEDFGGEWIADHGDFEHVAGTREFERATKDGKEYGMWTDGNGWVAFPLKTTEA